MSFTVGDKVRAASPAKWASLLDGSTGTVLDTSYNGNDTWPIEVQWEGQDDSWIHSEDELELVEPANAESIDHGGWEDR